MLALEAAADAGAVGFLAVPALLRDAEHADVAVREEPLRPHAAARLRIVELAGIWIFEAVEQRAAAPAHSRRQVGAVLAGHRAGDADARLLPRLRRQRERQAEQGDMVRGSRFVEVG